MYLKNYLHDPLALIPALASRGVFNLMPDESYLKLLYFGKLRKKLNLTDPKTYNEKLQWLKLHDRKKDYTVMVDKYEAKKYIAEKVGIEHVIPTLGVWNQFDDIDFDSLPDRFVLKCTHDSGGLVICRDKASLNLNEARKKIEKSLKRNYYLTGREWPYKEVVPRIIAEEYLEDTPGEALLDLKYFCFGGTPRIMYVSRDKSDDPRTDFFDMDFNHLNLQMRDKNADVRPGKPTGFEKMKELAALLSENIPHLRVDFYQIDGRIYVGELTFYHCSGFAPIFPSEWDEKLGTWIELPIEKGQ